MHRMGISGDPEIHYKCTRLVYLPGVDVDSLEVNIQSEWNGATLYRHGPMSVKNGSTQRRKLTW